MNESQSTETATTWNIDPAHSQVEFVVKHMMITKVRGRFADVSGTLRLDESDLSNSLVEVDIGAASIDTRQEDRDKHLRSGDFLDAETHPKLTFRSKRVEGAALEDGSEFRVVGDLTIRGTTREVALDAVFEGSGRDPWGGDRLAFSGSTEIDRREFGLEWNQKLETGGVLVGHDVKIQLEVQAVRAAEGEAEGG
jgi:polyisoprenoid-binding protein YceI